VARGKSPYGGDRGGGRKNDRKPGGQPGNTNARGSLILPRATDTEDRRAFLDAYDDAKKIPSHEKAETLLNLIYARVTSAAERLGIQRVIKALLVLDKNRLTEAQLDQRGKCLRREAAKDAAIGDMWKIVESCEHCGERVNQRLTGLEIELKQM
jgi:hypothetical protein